MVCGSARRSRHLDSDRFAADNASARTGQEVRDDLRQAVAGASRRRSTRSPTSSGRPIPSPRCSTSTTWRSSSSRRAARASSSTGRWSSASPGRWRRRRSTWPSSRPRSRPTCRPATARRRPASPSSCRRRSEELAENEAQLEMHEKAYENNLHEDQARRRKARRGAREDPQVRRRAEDEPRRGRDGQAGQSFNFDVTTDFGQIEQVIQDKISLNRAKVRVAADLSGEGIEDIEREAGDGEGHGRSRRSGSSRCDMGLVTPETAEIAETAKELGRGDDRRRPTAVATERRPATAPRADASVASRIRQERGVASASAGPDQGGDPADAAPPQARLRGAAAARLVSRLGRASWPSCYFSGTTCVFVLHGNVHDFVLRGARVATRRGTRTCSLAGLPGDAPLRRPGTSCFHYDLGRGLRPCAGQRRRAAAGDGRTHRGRSASRRRWPRAPDKVLLAARSLPAANDAR